MAMTELQHYFLCLAEECMEVGQRASKSMRFGPGELMPGQEENNFDRLCYELDDMVAIIEELRDRFGLEYVQTPERIAAKKVKVRRYLEYSIERGCVDDCMPTHRNNHPIEDDQHE